MGVNENLSADLLPILQTSLRDLRISVQIASHCTNSSLKDMMNIPVINV